MKDFENFLNESNRSADIMLLMESLFIDLGFVRTKPKTFELTYYSILHAPIGPFHTLEEAEKMRSVLIELDLQFRDQIFGDIYQIFGEPIETTPDEARMLMEIDERTIIVKLLEMRDGSLECVKTIGGRVWTEKDLKKEIDLAKNRFGIDNDTDLLRFNEWIESGKSLEEWKKSRRGKIKMKKFGV